VSRTVLLTLVALAVLLVTASGSFAQNGSNIAGVVKDTTGAVLPGVTVEASSPALIEKVRTVVTDGSGQYKIIDVRPGTYAVTFTLTGFSTVKRDGIELPASFTATVNADLRVGSVTETITVSGEAPTVDVQNVTQQRVMTHDLLDATPVGSKVAAAVGVFIPGIVVSSQDVGGTQSTALGTLAIHGGRSGEMLILMDGMDASNGQGRGGAYTTVEGNDAAITEMSLQTSALTAESELGGVVTNIIPRDGGNTFKGSAFGAYTNNSLQGSNLTPRLVALGALSTNNVDYIYDVDPGIGGPIKKDTLWFYFSPRQFSNRQQQAGLFFNSSPVPHIFTPDLGQPAYETTIDRNVSTRVTWQASPRNKFAFQDQSGGQIFDHYYEGNETNQPNATVYSHTAPEYFMQASWTSPFTSRLLLEAGASFGDKNYVWDPQPGNDPNGYAYTELTTGLSWGNPVQTTGQHASHNINTRFAASYVTGSHAAKFGITLLHSSSHWTQYMTGNETTLQLLNGIPSRVTVFAMPLTYDEVTKANVGAFAQDQWTHKRLTVNVGLRFDYLNSYVPASTLGPGPWVPNRSVTFPEVDNVPDWKNVTPRLGASYDLFGNGKTAVKFSLGKYLEGPNLTSFTRLANPAANIAVSATRTWSDANGDFIPQANELGPLNVATFGLPNVITTYSPSALTTRGYNWEVTGAIQHELRPGVSVSVSYARRSYGNIRATQNQDVTSASYSPYCVTAPTDPRLPGGGGNQLCGYYDVNQQFFGLTKNVIQVEPGAQDIYNGVDFTESVRLPRGITVTGGVSVGHEVVNNCYALNDLSLMSAFAGARLGNRCDIVPPFQPNVKFLVAYMLPWYGIQAGAAFQSIPGPQITASYTATNAQIAPSLGRNLTAGVNGTATIDLIPPATEYGDRLNQLDLRVTKRFKLPEGRSIQGNVDLYNSLNSDAMIGQVLTYGPIWLRPSNVLQARFVKFSLQFQF
jgi:Carboxypeptidase regulatory-like domain